MAGKFDPRQHPRGGDPRNSGRFSDRDLPEPAPIDGSDFQKELVDVLESASRLQELVPDAVLVGGSAAALYAGHRLSYDHDHIVNDLQDRYDVVLDALEREGDWVTNRTRPGKIILGSLGDIEAGVRQLIRKRPLECREATLPSGRTLRVPTAAETLRIKGFLCVKRNQVRDYLDVAALADRYGIDNAATVLARIDDYYADEQRGDEAVATQLARQLAAPAPADSTRTSELGTYKGLAAQWHDWKSVTRVLGHLAAAMLEQPPREE